MRWKHLPYIGGEAALSFHRRKRGCPKVRGFLIGMLGGREIRELPSDADGEFHMERPHAGKENIREGHWG